MTKSLLNSDSLDRLRRPALLGAVVFFAFAATSCGDDGDDVTGISSDCLEVMEEIFDELDLDEDQVRGIRLGQSLDASISETDFESEPSLIDFYVFELDDDTDVEVSANPEAGFDVVLVVADPANDESVISDDPDDEDATERVSGALEAGCYLVLVGNNEGDTGDYTIAVEED